MVTNTTGKDGDKIISKWPIMPHLMDLDPAKEKFNTYKEQLEQRYLQLYGIKQDDGTYLDKEFPIDTINLIGTISYAELTAYDMETLEEWTWDTIQAINRIVLQENYIAQVLQWLTAKLNKFFIQMPSDVLPFGAQDLKFEAMAAQYPVIGWLLDERRSYDQDALYWHNQAETLNKALRVLERITEKMKGIL